MRWDVGAFSRFGERDAAAAPGVGRGEVDGGDVALEVECASEGVRCVRRAVRARVGSRNVVLGLLLGLLVGLRTELLRR